MLPFWHTPLSSLETPLHRAGDIVEAQNEQLCLLLYSYHMSSTCFRDPWLSADENGFIDLIMFWAGNVCGLSTNVCCENSAVKCPYPGAIPVVKLEFPQWLWILHSHQSFTEVSQPLKPFSNTYQVQKHMTQPVAAAIQNPTQTLSRAESQPDPAEIGRGNPNRTSV